MMDLITEHLDIWTSAQVQKKNGGRGRGKMSNGKSIHGIKKLRELILDLAVRGKLVPQDPDDESAIVLLEKIAQEKKRLLKEGKLKKQKNLPLIAKNEKQFEIPQGWEYVRFGNITFNRDFERVPLSVDERKGRQGEYDYYGASGVIDSIDDFIFEEPLLLIGEDGANLINRSTPIAFIARGQYWVNNHAHVLGALTEGLLEYICLHINAISLEPYVTGTAQPKMNQAKMNSIVLALPPLVEQHRIVAKVDELMALCDKLEQQQTDSSTTHQTLVETLLTTLTNAANQNEFAETWQRIADHFDTLFTTEQSIDHLKQTILQLAVMGKLVPQDPDDEPANVFLERIGRKSKNVRKKSFSMISKSEYPFILPDNWEWIRFGDLGEILGGGTPSKSNPEFWGGEIPWISPKSMKMDYISDSVDKITSEAVNKSAAKMIPVDSLLIVVRGMILAHSFPAAINLTPVTINQDMKAVVLSGPEKAFILLMIKGLRDEFLKLVERSSHGTCKLVSNKLWNKIIGIPPLTEQRRIVTKVEELITLCDTLKASLSKNQTTKIHLADTIVEQVISQETVQQ
ncbi:restriction endonuclease subunit S [Desulfopila sp. IMCC35006]|uniref:restriction endonuclease subunit S n=1 Tax=Desulfopila sp. IMCC35006 TaxID=2569542 RepID=UPI00197A890A|nr:restriction endonuclease subunit S [Desulfopila sp. IMCC35006]